MSDDGSGIEFFDADDTHDDATEVLDTGPGRRRSTTLLVVAAFAAIALGAVVGVRQLSTDGRPSDPSVSTRSTEQAGPPTLAPIATPSVSVRQWEGVARTTARSVCATCAVVDAPTSVQAAARRALRTVARFRAVQLDGHTALIVSALLDNGVQLVAVLTSSSVEPDPTTFGVPPPLGVQSQRNGDDRLVVVIGGNVDAVALLGQAPVQGWLATLRR